MSPVFQFDLLLPILLNFVLLLIILVLWVVLRRRIAESQADQVRQSDQLDVLENKMARLEGALFYSPSATWAMETRREKDGVNPAVRKRL